VVFWADSVHNDGSRVNQQILEECQKARVHLLCLRMIGCPLGGDATSSVRLFGRRSGKARECAVTRCDQRRLEN